MTPVLIDVSVLARLPATLERIEQQDRRITELERLLAELRHTAPAADALVTIAEGAAITGRSEAAFRKLVQRGRVPFVKRGRSTLVRRADAEAAR